MQHRSIIAFVKLAKAGVRNPRCAPFTTTTTAKSCSDSVATPDLEIGAGSGHSLKAFAGEEVTRLDILAAPWIDVVADAHLLPMPGG